MLPTELQREYHDFTASEYGMNPIRVQITGTIPVDISGIRCTIPVGFAFPDQYPGYPPGFWLRLPPGQFLSGNYLTAGGQLSPVLFSNVPAQSPLTSYLAVLIKYLGDYPPSDMPARRARPGLQLKPQTGPWTRFTSLKGSNVNRRVHRHRVNFASRSSDGLPATRLEEVY
jgi:hypothetical protein